MANTRVPEPVSSEMRLASCAEVVVAKKERLLLDVAQVVQVSVRSPVNAPPPPKGEVVLMVLDVGTAPAIDSEA